MIHLAQEAGLSVICLRPCSNRGGHQGVWHKDRGAAPHPDDQRHRVLQQASGGSHRGGRFWWRPGTGSGLSLSHRSLQSQSTSLFTMMLVLSG